MCETKEKNTDYLVLVNEGNRIPEGFENTAVFVRKESVIGDPFQVEKKTYDAFCRLQEDVLKNDGIQIELLGSYRTIQQQEEIFEKNVQMRGLEYTKKYVAKPGCSEHHTGLAVDVGMWLEGKLYYTREDLLSIEHLFEIVHKKLPQYGFLLRYPKGKKAITKIAYEPWHYRYIDSPQIAQKITDQGICLEEYCGN